jgi:hypothetical protein
VVVENGLRRGDSFVRGFAALTRASLSFADRNARRSDGGVRPELLIVAANHRFVNRNLIRCLAAGRL